MTHPSSPNHLRPVAVRSEPDLRAGLWVAPDAGLERLVPREELTALTEIAPARVYRREERVFRAGEPVDGFYVLLEGRAKVVVPGTASGDRLITVLGPGDLFGTASCSGVLEHRATAVSASDGALVAAVTCDRLKEVARRAPGVALALSQVLAERVQALEEQVERSTLPVQARLARALLSLARRFGVEVEPDVVELELDLRHHEIASLAGATRVSASQALASWRSMGVVRGTRGLYRLDAARLEALVDLLEFEHLG